MGFLWVNGFSFSHCVASPFHSFVTILKEEGTKIASRGDLTSSAVAVQGGPQLSRFSTQNS